MTKERRLEILKTLLNNRKEDRAKPCHVTEVVHHGFFEDTEIIDISKIKYDETVFTPPAVFDQDNRQLQGMHHLRDGIHKADIFHEKYLLGIIKKQEIYHRTKKLKRKPTG